MGTLSAAACRISAEIVASAGCFESINHLRRTRAHAVSRSCVWVVRCDSIYGTSGQGYFWSGYPHRRHHDDAMQLNPGVGWGRGLSTGRRMTDDEAE